MRKETKEEKKRILQMFAEGKVSADEAIELLDALKPSGSGKRDGRSLRVEVDSEEAKVRVRMPFRLISAGFNIMKLIPKAADEAIKDKVDLGGIDFSKVDEEFLDALAELEVTVDGETKVRVYCE